MNIDTFFRLPGTSAQFSSGREKYTNAGILSNYDDDDYSWAYGQNKEILRALTEDYFLQPYISGQDISFSNVWADVVGYS